LGITAVTKKGVFIGVLLGEFAFALESQYGACYANSFPIVVNTDRLALNLMVSPAISDAQIAAVASAVRQTGLFAQVDRRTR